MINILCVGKIDTDYFHIYENDILKNAIDFNVIVFLDVKVGNVESLEIFLRFVKGLNARDKDVAILTSDNVLKYSYVHTFTASDIRDINDEKNLFYLGFNADSSDISSALKRKKRRKITLDDIDIIFSRNYYESEFSNKFFFANGNGKGENKYYVKPLMSFEPSLTLISVDEKDVDVKTKQLSKIEIGELERSDWEFKM